MADLTTRAMELLHQKSKQQNWKARRGAKNKKYKPSSTAVEDYVVLDFETTGFRAGADRIIQIGAVKYVKHEMKDVLYSLVNPQRHIPIAVTQLTGITNDMVASALTMEEQLEDLIVFIGDLPIISHNASFDMGFLYALEYRTTTIIPQFTVIDTVKLARKLITETPNHKLPTLTRFLQLEHEAHDALGDCHATAAIYQYCIGGY